MPFRMGLAGEYQQRREVVGSGELIGLSWRLEASTNVADGAASSVTDVVTTSATSSRPTVRDESRCALWIPVVGATG